MLNKKQVNIQDKPFIPTADSLLLKGAFQERWLSHPDSRIVINPFNFDDESLWGRPQSDYCNRSALPLNIGFLDPWVKDSRGPEIKDAIMIFEKTYEGTTIPQKVWAADCTEKSCICVSDGASLNVKNKGFVLKSGCRQSHDAHSAIFSCRFPASEKMMLVVHIGKIKGKWSLKVRNKLIEKTLRQETTTTGAFEFPLSHLGICENCSNFDIELSIHGRDACATVNDMRILKGECVFTEAVEYTTTWQPHKLGFEATYAGGLAVRGIDFLYDTRTVVRHITWDRNSKPAIAGEYKGTVLAEGALISISCGNYRYSIALSEKTVKPKFFRSLFELMTGSEPASEPFEGYGFFLLELPPESINNDINIAFTIDTYLVDMEDIKICAVNAALDFGYEGKLYNIKQFWDEFLSRVPRPGNFEFAYVDAKGVTPHGINLMYYTGWVLLEASFVPPSPEVGFKYKQLTAGKPSLWGYGDSRAVYTAAWDSLYGIQLCAFVDPDAAWDAFTGIMSMVDQDGMLAGESLPLMRARTAWILYQCKIDKEMLEVNFDKLELNLKWGLDHPYWIYMGNNPLDSTEKDVDFTASALIDMPYFIKICIELGRMDKAAEWEKKYNEFYRNYLIWTFPKDGSMPTQRYFAMRGNDTGDGTRSQGNALWITKSLYIDCLEKQYVNRLMYLFLSVFDKDKSFCAFPYVKLEDIQYTIYGLMEKGYRNEACTLIEASVRDVTRSFFFGENYTEDELPVCWGVRPSLFGVVQLVDGIWLRNGFRYDKGSMIEHDLFKETGFIENVHINGNVKNFGCAKI